MRYKKVLPHILFVILVGFFVFIQPSPTNNQVSISKETAKITRVIDGDTIEVSLNNKKEMVRLIGIDAPETFDPRKTAQCFGKEASDKAKKVLTGKTVILESDPTQGESCGFYLELFLSLAWE